MTTTTSSIPCTRRGRWNNIGQEWAHVLFRPAVRYQARRDSRLIRNGYDFADVEALIDEYKPLDVDIPERSNPGETERIGELGMSMGRRINYLDNIEPMAKALSFEGAGEALFGGCGGSLYQHQLRQSDGFAPAHRHQQPPLPAALPRHRQAQPHPCAARRLTGPEVLLAERMLNWHDHLEDGLTAPLPQRNEDALLDAIVESVEGQPWLDWRKIGVAMTTVPDSVKHTVALARQYAELGYDVGKYFERFAEIACRDDFTEMHSLKHFQAIVDEYETTRAPFRWLRMVAAAKSAAIIHLGREHGIYRQAKEPSAGEASPTADA